MYETLDQKEPVFDAKGIETVRRDACPAVAKVIIPYAFSVLNNSRESRIYGILMKYVRLNCNGMSLADSGKIREIAL